MEWITHYTSAAATTKTLSNSVASIRDNVAKRARARASKEKRVKMPDQKCKEGKKERKDVRRAAASAPAATLGN